MRFQEHYESPVYKGKIFSREEFEDWYVYTHDSPYHLDWSGFNLPVESLWPFFQNQFPQLSRKEAMVLEILAEEVMRNGNKGYVIACSNNDAATCAHEIVHAVYYLFPEYKEKVDKLLDTYDPRHIIDLCAHLSTIGYREEVFYDEINAYACTGEGDFRIPSELKKALKKLFAKHVPKVWGKNWMPAWSSMVNRFHFTNDRGQCKQYWVSYDDNGHQG